MRKKFDKEKDEKKSKRINIKRTCRFCKDKQNLIDFKRSKMLSHFLSEHCRILPRRLTGNCQFHQHAIIEAIKRARHLAMLPFTIQHLVRD